MFRGALRLERGQTASAPWPASALVACAELPGGAWAFASEDGTLYRAPTFLGALTVAGAMDGRAATLPADGAASAVSVRSVGALFAVAADRNAWTLSATGAPRHLTLRRVTHGVFVSERVALAVTEPGVLQRSDDGGEHFRVVALPAGAALSVGVDARGAFVRTTEGALRLEGETLAAASDVRPAAQDNAVDGATGEALARAEEVIPALPWLPGGVAANPDGSVSIARRDAIVTLDPRTGAEVRSVPAPGSDCAVARARDGLRAMCRHEGWATGVWALADGASAWTLLRDELRAEPAGRAVFDPSSRAWLVAAPCRQRTEVDTHRVCVYSDAGEPTELRLPFAAVPVAMSGGAAVVVDGEGRRQGPTRAVIVRGRDMTALSLSGGPRSAQTTVWDGRALMLWDLDPDGEHVLALVRGEPGAQGWSWTRRDAPNGARRGVFAPGGRAIIAGADASLLSMSVRGGDFAPLRGPVTGSGAALAFDLQGQWFCAGPWCRLGRSVLLSTEANREVNAVARGDAPHGTLAEERVHTAIDCHPDGVPTPGVEMDRGIAIAGYALRWQVAGDRVTVSAYGATLQGSLSARWPGAMGDMFHPVGAVGARTHAVLLERCAEGLCERAFASSAGLTPIEAPRTMPGMASLYVDGDGWIARVDEIRDGFSRVYLASLDARGAVRARRAYALPTIQTLADVGSLRGAPGLWVRESASRMRFHALTGEAGEEVTEAHAGCEGEAAPEGVARRVTEGTWVRGEDWLVERGEWLVEETLHIVGGRACVASIAGGEPRDEGEAHGREEHTPVRTFVLRMTGSDRATARAWAGHQVHAQRCTFAVRATAPR